MGRAKTFLKSGVLVFNVLVFFVGATVLALGIYILSSDYGAKELSSIMGMELYHVASYVAIGSGAAIAVLSLCGCCGSIKQNRCVLGTYLVFMFFILILLIAAAVFVFAFLGKINDEARNSMKQVLINNYGENSVMTDFWNFMQKELKCCGISGGINSTDSWAIFKTSTKWYKRFPEGKPYVPDSCCKPGGELGICTGMVDLNGPPAVGPPVNNTLQDNQYLYVKGCYEELVLYIQGHTFMIGGIAIGAVIVLTFGIAFAVCFCRILGQRRYTS